MLWNGGETVTFLIVASICLALTQQKSRSRFSRSISHIHEMTIDMFLPSDLLCCSSDSNSSSTSQRHHFYKFYPGLTSKYLTTDYQLIILQSSFQVLTIFNFQLQFNATTPHASSLLVAIETIVVSFMYRHIK